MASTPHAATPAAPPADTTRRAQPAAQRPDPAWAVALDAAAPSYYAFCRAAARLLRRGR